MKKIVLFLVVCVLLSFTPATAEDGDFTTSDFAALLVNILEIDLPVGSENLPDAEYYEVVANALAQYGIPYFIGIDPGSSMSYGQVANVIFLLIEVDTGGQLSDQEKIQYLVDNGYMAYADGSDLISTDAALAIFNNPEFAMLVAEAYEPPEIVEDRATVLGAPQVVQEQSASQI